jgi:membrane protein YdbS with pleckstrin-like domain
VPREPPTLPALDGERIEGFRPATGYLKYLKFWFWLLLWPMDVAILVAMIVIFVANWWVGLLLLVPAAVIAIVPDVLVYVGLHLRYDTTWYVMTDRSMRLRRGIWVIHETTITFENVQNVRLRQGPVQRHFGIADVVVETAGAGSATPKGHSIVSNQGVIEGIADAGQVRDRILQRLRRSTSAGLGDEDARLERPSLVATPAWTARHIALLAEIRNELRLLSSPST